MGQGLSFSGGTALKPSSSGPTLISPRASTWKAMITWFISVKA